MNLRCQHCGERIVARSFGKCPSCYRDLPADLQLSPKEKEMEELERQTGGGGGESMGPGSI
jgi:hypothetical protein